MKKQQHYPTSSTAYPEDDNPYHGSYETEDFYVTQKSSAAHSLGQNYHTRSKRHAKIMPSRYSETVKYINSSVTGFSKSPLEQDAKNYSGPVLSKITRSSQFMTPSIYETAWQNNQYAASTGQTNFASPHSIARNNRNYSDKHQANYDKQTIVQNNMMSAPMLASIPYVDPRETGVTSVPVLGPAQIVYDIYDVDDVVPETQEVWKPLAFFYRSIE